MSDQPEWDAFISHASEDKEHFVRPLANALASLGAQVWYDEFSLKLGDSLSASIDKGLARSRFGIIVLSPHFMSKPWPQRELAGLVTREMGGQSKILPIWHNVTRAQVSNFSPTLADKIAITTSDASAIEIALQVFAVIRPDLYAQHPRAQLEKLASGEALAELEDELESVREQLSEFQCPYCSSKLATSVDAPADPEEKHWDVIRTFECGYQDFGGEKRHLCYKDPNFPSFDDYELILREEKDGSRMSWTCYPRPKTKNARLVPLNSTFGPTRAMAEKRMKKRYEASANPGARSLADPF